MAMIRRPASSSIRRRPPFSKIFFSDTAWPIKAKFYMKHLWKGGTNVFINNPGHMTKMAAMPIYGKNPSKFFFSGTTGPISTKLGMKHRGLEYYNVFINYDRGGSNEYPQSMFWSKNKKNRYTPAYPSFAIQTWGLRGYSLRGHVFLMNEVVKRAPVIQAFMLALYWVGRDLTFLKHCGLHDFPRMNIESLSEPLMFAQTGVVILSFDCFPP